MQLTKKEVVELIENILAENYNEFTSTQAKLILQALEDNRILCLVEGEAKINDHIIMPYPFDAFTIKYNWQVSEMEELIDWKIAQRNSIPAYHCKQETK